MHLRFSVEDGVLAQEPRNVRSLGVVAKDDLPTRVKMQRAKTGLSKGMASAVGRMLPEYYKFRNLDAKYFPVRQAPSQLGH